MTPTEPLALPTRSEAIATELRRLIREGELAPGTPLRQVEIARRFAVSTTPVREAFAVLARDGFVRQDPHRGVVVFLPTLEDLRETYEIRFVLEPLATELATSRLSAADFTAIDDLMTRMRASVTAKDGASFGTTLNPALHTRIYRAAERPRLAAMIDALRDASTTYERGLRVPPGPVDLKTAQEEHEALVAALRARAPKRAAKLMHAHLTRRAETILAALSADDPAAFRLVAHRS
jgi:DNA-binding GntR family transcriptional regulator